MASSGTSSISCCGNADNVRAVSKYAASTALSDPSSETNMLNIEVQKAIKMAMNQGCSSVTLKAISTTDISVFSGRALIGKLAPGSSMRPIEFDDHKYALMIAVNPLEKVCTYYRFLGFKVEYTTFEDTPHIQALTFSWWQ